MVAFEFGFWWVFRIQDFKKLRFFGSILIVFDVGFMRENVTIHVKSCLVSEGLLCYYIVFGSW